MPPSLTCYGGVGEIGGNKFLLEEGDTKVILDFGTGFQDGADYFEGLIQPRNVNGAGDLFEFGLLPEIRGLYSEKALQNTELKHTSPEVDAVVLSHYHSDHYGRISLVDPEIPVYCGETTKLIHEAASASGNSALDDRELRTFRTGDKFTIGSMEFVPVHVDHSIPGAYGFIVHTSEATLAYTGDYRFHGKAGKMTTDFMQAASKAKPDVLLTEGTRVGPEAGGANTSEASVLAEARKMVKGTKKLVLSTFRGNDIDRVLTFDAAAKSSGRRLVVSPKVAQLLSSLEKDTGLSIPVVGKDVLVYLKRKKTGRLDDKDYYPWERKFIASGVGAGAIRERQSEFFLHLDTWNFPEVVDIKPERGGAYIHAATEAYNEEGEREEGVIKNWMRHLGFSYNQLHASGHAPMPEVERMVVGVSAKKVVPVHTEHPELFGRMKGRPRVELPVSAKGIPLNAR